MHPQSEIPATLLRPQPIHNPQSEIENLQSAANPQSPFLNPQPQTLNPPSPDPRPLNPTPRPRRGRPPRLDELKRREICALISTGAGIAAAARYVDCAASTIHREAHRNDDFRRDLRKACLDAELAPLNAVRQAAAKYWRAGAWLLERIDPQRFVKQNLNYVTVEQHDRFVRTVIDIVRNEIHDEETRRRISRSFDKAVASMDRETRAHTENFENPRRTRRRPDPRPAGQPSANGHPASSGDG